jgi:hypothetical protein
MLLHLMLWHNCWDFLSYAYSIINSVIVDPSRPPVLPFDGLPTSYNGIISIFIFKSKLFHLFALIRGFQTFADVTSKTYYLLTEQNLKHTHV